MAISEMWEGFGAYGRAEPFRREYRVFSWPIRILWRGYGAFLPDMMLWVKSVSQVRQAKRPSPARRPFFKPLVFHKYLVAGVGFEPTTFRL
jgi:hypothetical protein